MYRSDGLTLARIMQMIYLIYKEPKLFWKDFSYILCEYKKQQTERKGIYSSDY